MKRQKLILWITWLTFLIILISAIWLLVQNNGMVVTSADHGETTPFWHLWLITGIPMTLHFFASETNKIKQSI